jgi:protein arginine kinase
MNLQEFLISPVETARRAGPHDRIVLSSRVRLARNLRGAAFPGWAKKAERIKTLEVIRPAVEALPQLAGAFSEAMDNLGPLDKMILVERHLISREHQAKGAGSGLVLNKEESLCVMINEEDHLRMQALRPGLQLKQAWMAIDLVDTELETKLDYADQPDYFFRQQTRPRRPRTLRRRHRGAGECLPGFQPNDPGRNGDGHRGPPEQGFAADHRARGKRARQAP